ncbi:cysteine peptidase family C39 domain-containing protein [Pedobacter jejuensis]|uniref:Peptidase C39 domain-containing protein n=1 Tax=Pedobacter jejuensis TaxID=1268550 RepID=A0A3N0C038_9SPHI|nr:thioredoxin domain-containing protein [Pedobacter jejuensis]RNL55405.1 hypothetical protein D7004_04815 [Pedobacter jejuensis]
MNLFKTKTSNLESVTYDLIKALSAKVLSPSISECLKAHPDFPSMLSISDCLTDWNIQNKTYHIRKEEYNVNDLLFPFIAYYQEAGGRFVLINSIENGIVRFSDENHKKSELKESEFLKRWNGVVLYAEKNDTSGEVDYKKNRVKSILNSLLIPGFLIFIITSFLLFYSTIAFSSIIIISSLLKICGTSISVLLIIQSINSNNPFIQNLCGLTGNKDDCNAILKSEAAKVTSWLSWSEVGLFYFSGTLLSLISVSSSLVLLAWLNALALPYVIYSISYQYSVKKWCVLCCMVQILLVLEFVSNLYFGVFNLTFNPLLSNLSILILCLAFPILMWSFLKPFFSQAAELPLAKYQLKKFKFNNQLFQQALTNQPRFAISEELRPIVLGNPNAETIITMVSNPFCGPCAAAHKKIESLLAERTNIRINIVFIQKREWEKSDKMLITQHLFSLMKTENESIGQALNSWYSATEKNYSFLAKQYPIPIDNEAEKTAKLQHNWCDLANVTFTPTFFINGYKLPEPYRIEDLKYLLN